MRNSKDDFKDNKRKGPQCSGCEEFGHIKAACLTFMKKQEKRLFITWSEFDAESEGEASKVMNFTRN